MQVTFMEPPPLYSENDNSQHDSAGDPGYSSGRFELPPPYSPLDERDTAGLIRNQSDERRLPSLPSYSQSPASVHQGTNRAPTPPIRTSSIPQQSNNSTEGTLRLRRTSGAQSDELRPLTGITRQQSKDKAAPTPGTPKILKEEDSQSSSQSSSLNIPSIDAAIGTHETCETQTDTIKEENTEHVLASQIDNQYSEALGTDVSVA